MSEIDPLVRRKSRIQLLLMTGVFVFPMLLGTLWFQFSERLAPEGRTHLGQLLSPVLELTDLAPAVKEQLPIKWNILLFQSGDCDEACKQQQYKIQQLHIASGKYAERIQPVFLHDQTFAEVQIPQKGWVIVSDNDRMLLKRLQKLSGSDHRIYIADPRGNIMLAYPGQTEPGTVWHDLKKMLKVSRIG